MDSNDKSIHIKKLRPQAPEISKSWVSEAIPTLPEKICSKKAGFPLNFPGNWVLEEHKICIGPAGQFLPHIPFCRRLRRNKKLYKTRARQVIVRVMRWMFHVLTVGASMPGWHVSAGRLRRGLPKRAPAKSALKPVQAWNAGSCCQYFNHHRV